MIYLLHLIDLLLPFNNSTIDTTTGSNADANADASASASANANANAKANANAIHKKIVNSN